MKAIIIKDLKRASNTLRKGFLKFSKKELEVWKMLKSYVFKELKL